MSYVNLHTHSDYSLLDGASQLPQLIDRAAELGMPAIALTDHGVMYGALQLIKLCRNKNIKAIIGNEMYVVNGDLEDKKTKRKKYHQIVLAKNTDGYKNLVKLTTVSHLDGFQGKGIFGRPCINKEYLEKHGEGLIVTSGCMAGEVPQNILKGEIDEARKVAKWYKKIFGADYYLEIQDHGYPADRIINVAIVKIAKELGIKIIATNDSHFTNCQDVDAHDALLCINTQKLITEEKRMRYSGTEYLKSAEEMKMLFRDHLEDEVIEEAIANTLEVAEKIKTYDLFGDTRIPNYPIPSGHNPETYLQEVSWEGLLERLKVKSKSDVSRDYPQYEERLKYELSMIEKMGFSTYFLVVWDYIKFARDNNIPVGPGRGSAAGSLVAYALKITNIDPVHHGLLFERFLNPERKSMPDIDTDFSIDRRDDMIKYVTEKYGVDKVAQIVTFNRMTSKAVLKDVARVLGVPYGEADKMAKLIPVSRGKPTKLKVMVSDETPTPEFKEAYEKKMVAITDSKGESAGEIPVRQWIDMAITIEGTNRTFGVHAAGVLISKEPLDEIVPLQRNNDGAVITQYFMEDLEALGLLKMDFLGLKNLTIIQNTTKAIYQNHNLVLDAESLPADERRAMAIVARTKKLPEDVKNTYKLIASGDLEGVFQLESSGMMDIVRRLKPSNIEDISSILALYRPGPLDAGLIPKFIDRKHGREEIRYDHVLLEPILNETYGVLCLPKGTLIDKPDGSMEAIENVRKGDTILTSDGSRVWEAKVAKQWRSGVKEILKITLSSGTVIFAGKNHRFLTPEGDKFAWELKSAAGGIKNAHIYGSAVYEKWPVSSGKKKLRENEAYLLGLLIGNGNLVSSTPNIACPTEKGAAWVANLIYETWGGEAKYYFHTRCWYAYSKFNTQPKPTPLTEFMNGIYGDRSWKVKSVDKHLPEDILDYAEKDRIDLLRGLWDSDGCYSERLVYYRSSSPQLLEQVGKLLGSLKIAYYLADNYVGVSDRSRFISMLGCSQMPNKQREEVRDNYLPVSAFALATGLENSIRQTDSSTRKTVRRSLQKATLFRPTNSQYKTKLENWDDCYREIYEKTYLQDARLVYVVSVEEAGEAECFDLEMEDQSSPYFLAQGVVVHNCYQEQIMKMAQDLAGYSLGQADLLRRCLSGDTEIVDVATGNLVKISEIAHRPEYWLGRKLFSLDLNTQEIVEQPISEIHRNGRRLVWEITTRTNRKIKATQEHLFYTVLGWRPLEVLQKGDRLALAKQLPIINTAEIEKEIIGEPKATGEKVLQPKKFASGTTTANSELGNISVLQKDSFSNSQFPIPHSQKAVSFRFSPKLKRTPDVFWDEIISIEYVGVEEVFDLSIPQTHNFVANDFVVHNCMGKKKVSEMEKHREMFIDGAAKKGVSSKIAQNLFEQMIKFAEYCFNKSHSTAYAYVSYQTAYLKANYPVEYMAALLTANSGDQDKVQKYIANCQRFNIEVEPPDINRSKVDFTPLPKSASGDGRGRILFGLSAVKNLGDGAIMEILKAREEKGPFVCLADLCDRVNQQSLNSRALESLIYCGAFDKLESNRQKLIKELPDIIAWAQKRQRDRDTGQLNLFDLGMGGTAESENGFESAPQKTNVADFSAKEKLNKEKELLGFYVSDHPLKYILEANPVEGALKIAELKDKEKKTKGVVKLVAMVAGQKLHTTKKGDRMAFLQIEDMTGQMEAIIFPKTFEEVGPLLEEVGAVLLLTGKAETKDDEVQLLVEEAKRIQEEMADAVEKGSPINIEGEGKEEGEGEEEEEAIAPATPAAVEMPPEEIEEVEIETPPESEHPAKLARRGRGDVVLVESLEDKPEKVSVRAIGKLTRVKVITTKKGDEMAFLEIEDETGKVDVTVFPSTYNRFKHLLEEEEEETLLLVTGKTEKREGRVKLTADKLELVAAEESSPMPLPPEEHFPETYSPPPPPSQTVVAETSMSVMREVAIVLQLTPEQVADGELMRNLQMVLEEYAAKGEKAVVPVMAMVAGKSCRQLVRFDRRFWVEDLEVAERLKGYNFNVGVSRG